MTSHRSRTVKVEGMVRRGGGDRSSPHTPQDQEYELEGAHGHRGRSVGNLLMTARVVHPDVLNIVHSSRCPQHDSYCGASVAAWFDMDSLSNQVWRVVAADLN